MIFVRSSINFKKKKKFEVITRVGYLFKWKGMIEWVVMFKSASFFLLVLNIVFIFVEFNEKKGIGKRGATKTGKTNTHCGLIF